MLNKVKKASVLITNYNNAQYIDACINSILSQQYSNIEIIFIDFVLCVLIKSFKHCFVIRHFVKQVLSFLNE